MQLFKVEPVQEEWPARSCLGFFSIVLSSIVASSTVLGPTSRANREIYSPGRTGSSYEKLRPQRRYSYPSKKLLPTPGAQSANTPAPEPAPRRAGPSGLTGPCTGCRDSNSDSGPEHWEWDLGKDGGYCRRVLEPPLSPQPIVPFQPELPFPGAPVSATAVLPEMSPPQMRFFIRAFISPHAAWNLCSPAAFLAQEPAATIL